MTCKDIEQNLIARLENTLSEDLRMRLDAHARECADCRALLAMYEPLFKSDALPQAVPHTLWRAVQSRINELEKGRHHEPTLLPIRRPFFGLALQSLGVAAAIIAGVLLGRSPQIQATTETDELLEYYASGLATQTLPIDDVYEQVGETNGGGQ